MRWLAIAHHLPDRTRLRTPVLRNDARAAERVADALAAIPGVCEVKVRPYTGSILIAHKPKVALDALLDVARPALAIERVLAVGETLPAALDVPAFSSVARKLVSAVRELDRDIRRQSAGSVDLGMLATLGFVTAGAAEIAISGELPLPPWFNLAWWAYRTFMTTEEQAMTASRDIP